MKTFTPADISRTSSGIATISPSVDYSQLVDAPLRWQGRGLQQTASGYGRRLTSRYKISYRPPSAKKARLYRLYITCFSNVGSVWFEAATYSSKKEKIYVS